MTTRELKLERGCLSFLEPKGAWVSRSWFHELPNADDADIHQERAEICASGIEAYVELSKQIRYITIVASDRETPECFDIRADGRITEVWQNLDSDFQLWLRGCYHNGLRFIQLEIGK